MARDSNHLSNDFDTENTGGVLSGFLAEEDSFDRRALWRLGSWGAATVAAVTLAVLANQSSLGWRRDQVAAADLARQAQQVQAVASESHGEARRLASAIETLNGDRDRLYSRVTVLEQGLDSVTGAVARQTAAQNTALPWPQQAPAFSPAAEPPVAANPPPAVSPVATAAAAIVEKSQPAAAEPAPATVASVDQVASNSPAATPLMPARSMLAPPDAPASKLIEPDASRKNITASPMPDVTASVDPEPEATEAPPKLSLRRTEFGVAKRNRCSQLRPPSASRSPRSTDPPSLRGSAPTRRTAPGPPRRSRPVGPGPTRSRRLTTKQPTIPDFRYAVRVHASCPVASPSPWGQPAVTPKPSEPVYPHTRPASAVDALPPCLPTTSKKVEEK